MTSTYEEPEYKMPWEGDGEAAVVDPAQDAKGSNSQIEGILAFSGEAPEIAEPVDGYVLLPGGMVTEDGVVRDAVVRELNGEDEEVLAKAASNPLRYVQALLRGVETIGGSPVDAKALRRLLIGDREALILAIRIATFGDKIEFINNVCPHCEEEYDVNVDLNDLPRKTLEDPEVRQFEVPLRDGTSLVRLPDGDDQWLVMEDPLISDAERNTILLSRVVLEINGKKVNKSKDVVRRMGLVDRKTLLKFLTDTQPGPRYDEAEFTHETCGKQVPIYLSVGDLFRELTV